MFLGVFVVLFLGLAFVLFVLPQGLCASPAIMPTTACVALASQVKIISTIHIEKFGASATPRTLAPAPSLFSTRNIASPSLGLNGSVGIGTTAPTGLLSVNSAATGSPYGVYATLTGASNTGYAGYFSNSSTSGYALYANGTIGAALVSGAAAPVTGVLAVTSGGTGDTTLTANGVLYGNGTGAIGATAQGGTNTILTANGGAPSFSATPTINTSVTVPLVIGGTTASSTLTLESTSGSGTSDSILFKTGSQATAMTINASGSVGVSLYGPRFAAHARKPGTIAAVMRSADGGKARKWSSDFMKPGAPVPSPSIFDHCFGVYPRDAAGKYERFLLLG